MVQKHFINKARIYTVWKKFYRLQMVRWSLCAVDVLASVTLYMHPVNAQIHTAEQGSFDESKKYLDELQTMREIYCKNGKTWFSLLQGVHLLTGQTYCQKQS